MVNGVKHTRINEIPEDIWGTRFVFYYSSLLISQRKAKLVKMQTVALRKQITEWFKLGKK